MRRLQETLVVALWIPTTGGGRKRHRPVLDISQLLQAGVIRMVHRQSLESIWQSTKIAPTGQYRTRICLQRKPQAGTNITTSEQEDPGALQFIHRHWYNYTLSRQKSIALHE